MINERSLILGKILIFCIFFITISCNSEPDKFKVFNNEIFIHSKGLFFFKDNFFVSYLNEKYDEAYVIEFDSKGNFQNLVCIHPRFWPTHIFDIEEDYLMLVSLVGRNTSDSPKIYYDTLMENTYPKYFTLIGTKEVIIRMDGRAYQRSIGRSYVIDSFKLDKSNNTIYFSFQKEQVAQIELAMMEVFRNKVVFPRLEGDKIAYDEYFFDENLKIQDLISSIINSN